MFTSASLSTATDVSWFNTCWRPLRTPTQAATPPKAMAGKSTISRNAISSRLRMVNARSAGVMFTADPATGDNTKLTLEGSWGLGESVVSGSVIPDVWLVDRTRYEIIDRRTRGGPASDPAGQEIPALEGLVAGLEEHSGCLSDQEVIELARIGARVEQHFGTPQDIEWAIDSDPSEDRFYLLQTRNEKFSIRFAGF